MKKNIFAIIGSVSLLLGQATVIPKVVQAVQINETTDQSTVASTEETATSASDSVEIDTSNSAIEDTSATDLSTTTSESTNTTSSDMQESLSDSSSNTSESISVSETGTTETAATKTSTTETSSSESSEEPNTDSSETEIPDYKVTKDGETNISSWDSFVTALADTTVTKINVIGELKATKNAVVDRKVEIDFQKHTVDFASYTIKPDNKADLLVKDLLFTGNKGIAFEGYRSDNTGKVTFTGELTAQGGSSEQLVALSGGTVVFDNAKFTYSYDTTSYSSQQYAITAKNLTFTNLTQVNANAYWFFNSDDKSNLGGKITIDGGSVVNTISDIGSNSKDAGLVWYLFYGVDFSISGAGSKLYVKSNADNSGSSGNAAFAFGDRTNNDSPSPVTFEVKDGADFTVEGEGSSALYMNSKDMKIHVTNGASMHVIQDTEISKAGGTNATFNIGTADNQELLVDEKAKFEVIKNNGASPAVRIASDNSVIKAASGADFIVKQLAPDPTSTWDSAQGQAILFSNTSKDLNASFIATGENSNVDLTSLGGGVIQQNAQNGPKGSLSITGSDGVFFIARGKVDNHTLGNAPEGIFESDKMTFKLDHPKYYDFRNNNGLKGKLFVGGAGSTLSTSNTNISFWRNTANLDGNANHFWKDATFQMSGANLAKLDSTNIDEMKEVFSGGNTIESYGRISANNQIGRVDKLHATTDADKFIFAHAGFPEGKYDPMRDANKDEVNVEVAVTDVTGKTVTLNGNTEGTQDIYDETEQNGWTKIPYDGFLPTKGTVQVTKASLLDNDNNPTVTIPPGDVTEEIQSIQDATPPEPFKTPTPTFAPGAKEIKGTGEAGSMVTVAVNGKDIGIHQEIGENGQITISIPDTITLAKGDKVQIFEQDKAAALVDVKPPLTNSESGNIEPAEQLSYHDATFAPATILDVNGVLAIMSVPDFDFGTQKLTARTETFRPKTVSDQLVISDTRGKSNSNVSLYVKEVEPLTNEGTELTGALSYTNTQGVIQTITGNAVKVEDYQEMTEEIVSDNWNTEQGEAARGLSLTVPGEKQKLGTYKGTIQWSVQDVPANE